MDAFGFVQGTCGAPNFDRPGTSTEAQAFCILMEAAGSRVDGAARRGVDRSRYSTVTDLAKLRG